MKEISDALKPLGPVVEGAEKFLSTVLHNSELVVILQAGLLALVPPPWNALASSVLVAVAHSMGVDDNPDKLGYQMNIADRKPEDFATFRDYKEYLDANFPFDADGYFSLSETEKCICGYIGMSGIIQEIKESGGVTITPEMLGSLARVAARLAWDEKTLEKFAVGLSGALKDVGIDSVSAEQISQPNEDIANAINAGIKSADLQTSVEEIEKTLSEVN